jgi:Acetoacetate decarboxylase (ADC)
VSEPSSHRVPPAPWRLRGSVTIVPALARLADARARVGSAGRVMPVAPGRTLGGALLASYESGSTLRYHELLVASALVRRGPTIGLWVDHAWVDSASSLAGGRQIWAIPKRRARFSERERGAMEVRADDGALLTVRSGAPRGPIVAVVAAAAGALGAVPTGAMRSTTGGRPERAEAVAAVGAPGSGQSGRSVRARPVMLVGRMRPALRSGGC